MPFDCEPCSLYVNCQKMTRETTLFLPVFSTFSKIANSICCDILHSDIRRSFDEKTVTQIIIGISWSFAVLGFTKTEYASLPYDFIILDVNLPGIIKHQLELSLI